MNTPTFNPSRKPTPAAGPHDGGTPPPKGTNKLKLLTPDFDTDFEDLLEHSVSEALKKNKKKVADDAAVIFQTLTRKPIDPLEAQHFIEQTSKIYSKYEVGKHPSLYKRKVVITIEKK